MRRVPNPIVLAAAATLVASAVAYGQSCPCGSSPFGPNLQPSYGPGQLAFVGSIAGQSEVLSVIVAGPDDGPFEVAVHIGSTNLNSPAWAPDGAHIVFS